MSSLPKIYWGVINPEGEDNEKSTYYFQKFQLPLIAKQVIGKPIKILHHHQDENGNPTPASGVVVHSHVHPKTGKLWAGFVLNPTPAGNLARVFLGENNVLPKEFQMGELSLGFDIFQDTKTGNPIGHVIKELSICHLGARPGCQIKGSAPYESFITKKTPPSKESLKIDQKKIIENINKYFSKNNTKEYIKEEEKKDPKMMNSLKPAEAINQARPVEDAENYNDSFNKTLTLNARPEVTIIPGQASTVTEAPQDEQKQYLEMMQRALETHQQQVMNTTTSLKREREEDEEPPKEKLQMDFSKFMEGMNQEWKEPPLPEGLNEAQLEAFKQANAERKELWEQREALKRENRRKFLERLQSASDEIIPTWIKYCEKNGKACDQQALAATMASISEVQPQVAEQFISFVEAQAKQNVSSKNLKKDINQLEQEYQAKFQKLEKENEELKKNQARPPVAPVKQQQQVAAPPQQQQQQFTLKDLPTIARIYAQAALKTNEKLSNIPGASTPIELAVANGMFMQRMFDKYTPGSENATMQDLYGTSYKNAIKGGAEFPGMKKDSGWYKI